MSKGSRAVSRLTLQARVAAGEVIDLRNYFRVESHASGSVVYRPGDPAARIYLLRSGRVRLLRLGMPVNGTPAEFLHAILRPGDLFGEALRPHGAVMEDLALASGDTEVWSIEGRDLDALVEARPALAVEIIRGLNERNRALRRRVNALTFKDVPARLAEVILALCESHGEPSVHGAEIDLRGVTQQDLADLVGASRSFVSTLVNELKRDGLLGNVGRTLCIRSQGGLRRLASHDRV